ncbi:MAG: hypothetical protein DWQ41_20830 [Planctomycetota bacterium]|nr:MAG: hypothetical protein DWQ41_20830 [Planctomycetota bacterium]
MRPGGLTAICVVAFVLAAFGMFTILGGCFGLIAQQFMGEMMSSFSSMPAPTGPGAQQFQANMDAQRQMYEDMAAMQRRHLPLLIAQYLFHLTVIALLIVAGIRAMQGKRNARRLLTITMGALIAFTLFRLVPQILIQTETQEITTRYMSQIMQATPGPGGAPAVEMSKSIMSMSTAFGVAIWGVWTLVLLGYAGASIWYVNQPQVVRWFQSCNALEIESFADASDSPPETDAV